MTFIIQDLKDSTAIKRASYDKGRMILLITFQTGGQYMYFDVEDYQVQDLITASSVGHEFYYGVRDTNDYDRMK